MMMKRARTRGDWTSEGHGFKEEKHSSEGQQRKFDVMVGSQCSACDRRTVEPPD